MNQAKMPMAKARPLPEYARPAVAGVLDETENLERDHRQDARHEIEDETSNEAEKEELQQTSGRLCRGGDFRRGRCGHAATLLS